MAHLRIRGSAFIHRDDALFIDAAQGTTIDARWREDARRQPAPAAWISARSLNSARDYVVATTNDRVDRVAVAVDDIPLSVTNGTIAFQRSHRLYTTNDSTIAALLTKNIGTCVKVAVDPGSAEVVSMIDTTADVSQPILPPPLDTDWQAVKLSAPATGAPLLNIARWRALHRRLQIQPHIPFAYPTDGCWARAAAMVELLVKYMNISASHVFKVWVESDQKGVNLDVSTNLSPECGASWLWHVAVRVVGSDDDWVLDPALFDEPVTVPHWLSKLTVSRGGYNIRHSLPQRYHYFPEQNDPNQLSATLDQYRDLLAAQIVNDGPQPYACA